MEVMLVSSSVWLLGTWQFRLVGDCHAQAQSKTLIEHNATGITLKGIALAQTAQGALSGPGGKSRLRF